MRIAVISPFVDRQHGTERAVVELIERLAAQYKDKIDLYAQHVDDISLNPDSAVGANDGGIVWHRVRSLPGPHLIQFLGWIFLNRAARWWQAPPRNRTPTVIFSPGINTLDADVILVHAVFHRVAELQKDSGPGGLRALHRRFYYGLICNLERRIFGNPRVKLAAVSRHTAKQLAHYFGRTDVAVIPNGVDSNHFSPQEIATMREKCRREWKCMASDFVLLLIGNDWRNKGLLTLLESLARCKDLPVRLLVVGQDAQKSFRTQTEKLQLSDRVQFFSPVLDVRTFYAAADLLAAPSLEDSFNLPVLEAMSCGLPVVVSPRAGVSEWLTNAQDSIVLNDPENVEELSDAIRMLAQDSALRQTIAANALQTAKRFSWDAHTSDLRKLLVQAAEEKPRHCSQKKN